MPRLAPTRIVNWKRLIGAFCIGVAAFAVAFMMFVGAGWARPWHMGVALALAGLGLVVLRHTSTPRKATRTRVDQPVLLLAGVFFTFGTLGPLMLLVFQDPALPPQGGLVAVVIGGLIACGWAAAFIFRRLWLIPLVILAQVFVPVRVFNAMFSAGLMHNIGDLSEQSRRGVLAMLALACVVLGYVLMVMFVRRAEAAQAHAHAELDVARKVHETLVPPIDIAEPGLEVHGSSRASTEMGGDLIDVIRTGDRTDIILADVSGHGVGAGIVMGMLKSSVRTLLRRHVALEDLFRDLNAVLADLVRPGMFATAVVVRLDRTQPGHIEFALAGHLPILLARGSGSVEELRNDALPLAVDAHESFSVGRVDIAPGDTILLLTDGLAEVQSPAGRQLGFEALRTEFARRAKEPLPAIAAALGNLADAHGKQSDDQSLVLIRV